MGLLLAFWAGFSAGDSSAQTATIRQYQFQPRADGKAYELVLKEVARPAAGPGEVLVRVRAASINGGLDVDQRDQPPGRGADLTGGIPLADGAGEVIALGPGVTRFKRGDRVAGTFFRRWLDGDLTREMFASIRGGNSGGMLSEVIVSSQDALVRIPDYLSYEEAATLPTAGVTAWVGLFKDGHVMPGQYVLLEGTGGVSSFGLVLAVAAGAKPIVTSSSDMKLERAKQLGAVGTVNYRKNPDWQVQVRALTGGAGVKQVLEVGGKDTLPKALQALAFDGHVALIGSLSGAAQQIPVGPLFGTSAHLSAVFVGSRADFEAMNAFLTERRVHPVIDRVFDFAQAPEAFDLMAHGDYMGKIVIRLPP